MRHVFRMTAVVCLAACQAIAADGDSGANPPIPVRFALYEPGFVTLVVDNADGVRVRNLIAETWFEAGEHVAWWDGLDEGRSIPAPRGAVQAIGARSFVPAGTYRVRGLARKQIDLRYEFSVNTAGNPPWFVGRTGPASGGEPGGWLADHSPPTDVLYVPGNRPPHYRALRLSVQSDGYVPDKEKLLFPCEPPVVMIGSPIAEAGHGLAWADLAGNKLAGIRSYGHGGRWFPGAYAFARDAGDSPVPGVYAYYAIPFWASANDREHGKIYIQSLPNDVTVYEPAFDKGDVPDMLDFLGGIAVRDGIMAVSLTQANALAFVDVRNPQTKGIEIGTFGIDNPRGVAFDAAGRILVLSGKQLLRFAARPATADLTDRQTLVSEGLDDPRRLALDSEGNVYVSDWGASHQVKAFTPNGKPLRVFGRPGPPHEGPYDPLHMSNPLGITITTDGLLWVAENNYAPKRVSIWKLDGSFVKGLYGPPKYGGGGDIDDADRDRFYYAEGQAGMAFALDWPAGGWKLDSIYYRKQPGTLDLPPRYLVPQKPIHLNGRDYMTNAFSSWATYGSVATTIGIMRNGLLRPAAIVGQAAYWELLRERNVIPELPESVTKAKDEARREQSVKAYLAKTLFAWCDANGNARLEQDEVSFSHLDEAVRESTVGRDLTILVTTETRILRLKPAGFTDSGVPLYDLRAASVAVDGGAGFTLGGVNSQAVEGDDGWIVKIGAPLRGYRDGNLVWTYHNQWPSLHAGHAAPRLPEHPGQLIATTRLLGWTVKPRSTDVEIWSINSDRAVMYLMTVDGLYVAQLGKHVPDGPQWGMPEMERGMLLNGVNFVGEHFWPTITQTADGGIYMVAGKSHSSIIRIEGLETIRRLPETALRVTNEQLAAAAAWFAQAEAHRQQEHGQTQRLAVRIIKPDNAPKIDGDTGEWDDAQWVRVDDKTTAAVCVAGNRLYAAWRGQDCDLLNNTGESGLPMLFATGGSLDIMIATDPKADPKRVAPAPGDQRLVVTRIAGKTVAALFRANVPGTEKPIMYNSPVSTVTIDRVDDVSGLVELAQGRRTGPVKAQSITWCDYELSIPLDALGLAPRPGMIVKADVGLLRGQGGDAVERVYWHNKATGVISDIPTEAKLTPNLWGEWVFDE